MLYGWDDGRFEEEYLKKLEKNWQRWKTVSPEENLEGGVMSRSLKIDLIFISPFYFYFY